MLQRVGQAISRILKPITISESSLSRNTSSDDGQKPIVPTHSKKEKREEKNEGKEKPPEGFQRFNSPKSVQQVSATEEAPEELPNDENTPKASGGLTSAFLQLLRQLQDKRKGSSFGLGVKGYQNSEASQKKGKSRKGMVVNNQVG